MTDVVEQFPAPGVIYDVGGGNGYMTRALKDAGHPTVLVEPVEQGARTAFQRGLQPVVNSTLEHAEFPPGSLPAVGMFDVLEHVDDDLGMLREIRDLLAPGGRLYLTVPAHPRLWSAHDDEAGHRRRYTSSSLRAVVADAGLTIERSSLMFSILLVPLAIRALVQRHVRKGEDAADVYDPTGNAFLRWRFSAERRSLRRRDHRTGTSLLLVARRD
jgi:SAM-dependent methyltransferase